MWDLEIQAQVLMLVQEVFCSLSHWAILPAPIIMRNKYIIHVTLLWATKHSTFEVVGLLLSIVRAIHGSFHFTYQSFFKRAWWRITDDIEAWYWDQPHSHTLRTVLIWNSEYRAATTQHTENSPREPGTVISGLLHVKTVEIVYPSTQWCLKYPKG